MIERNLPARKKVMRRCPRPEIRASEGSIAHSLPGWRGSGNWAGFALDRDYVEADPTARIKKAKIGPDGERDRVLNEAELIDFFNKLPKSGLAETSQARRALTRSKPRSSSSSSRRRFLGSGAWLCWAIKASPRP